MNKNTTSAEKPHYIEIPEHGLYVADSMVMLLISVVRHYTIRQCLNNGVVDKAKFLEELREIGPMDEEQITRVFDALDAMGFIRTSSDGKYLIDAGVENAEEENRKQALRNKWIEAGFGADYSDDPDFKLVGIPQSGSPEQG